MSFKVYNWAANGGYNTVYNTSHRAAFYDDDSSYDGISDTNETVSIDGGPAGATTGSPHVITVDFIDASGAPHVEQFNFFLTNGQFFFAPLPGSSFSEGATLGSYQSHFDGWDYSEVACFCRGTFIETIDGHIRIEHLTSGIKLRTFDNGFATLLSAVSTKVTARCLRTNHKLKPIKISADALGVGYPSADLYVSRQHRMLVNSPIAQRMFGERQVLVSAIKLTNLPGVSIDEDTTDVEYFHLIFARHQIIFANGAPSESFHINAASLKALPLSTSKEIHALFPAIETCMPQHEIVRLHPNNSCQKQLVSRHSKNQKPLFDPSFNSLAAQPETPANPM